MSRIDNFAPEMIATETLVVDSTGRSFTEITGEAMRFVSESRAKDGALFLFLRHTSASLVVQENADPDVRSDLVSALDRLAPADAPWVHAVEGPDDMPAHVKTMLTGSRCTSRWSAVRLRSAPGKASLSPNIARGLTGANSCCNSSAAGGNRLILAGKNRIEPTGSSSLKTISGLC